MIPRLKLLPALVILCLAAMGVHAGPDLTRMDRSGYRIETVASGVTQPWAIGFLPGGAFLVTERGGRLLHFDRVGSDPVAVRGVPKVFARGQGGLLDVLADRDFVRTRRIFLTYSAAFDGGAGTHVASATLSGDGRNLTNLRVLFRQTPALPGGRHFGSRLVQTPDGRLFVTLGERGDRQGAQSDNSYQGKVVVLDPDGGPVPNLPFAGSAIAQAWTTGHRNPQGAALDAQGRVWVVEHGPRGGDEINLLRRGRNYGWPVIGYGVHYDGTKVGTGTHAPGMEQPAFYWDPSIAPSGMAVLSGKMFSDWRGDFLVGSLKFNMISRLRMINGRLVEVERLSSPQTGRVRDVREAPDGSIWFLSVQKGAVYRFTPPS